MSHEKIAVCGFGKMGESLALGLIQGGTCKPTDFLCTVAHERSQARVQAHNLTVASSNREAVAGAQIVLLTVKPNQIPAVFEEISPVLTPDKLIISIAAGVSIREMASYTDVPVPIIRAMPNTPTLIGQGVTVYCGGQHATAVHLDTAKKIFNAVGAVVELDESRMDAATGLSGCGPAYVYLIIEALAEAGVKVGISRDISMKLIAHTVQGSAALMLKGDKHPALLKDDVTTPGGCAIDGLVALEEGGVRTSLINAVVQATKKARQLSTKKDPE